MFEYIYNGSSVIQGSSLFIVHLDRQTVGPRLGVIHDPCVHLIFCPHFIMHAVKYGLCGKFFKNNRDAPCICADLMFGLKMALIISQ